MKQALFILLFLFTTAAPIFAAEQRVIRLSGPPVAESLPLAMMSGNEIAPGVTVQFIPWHSPDQIRAMIAGGQVDGAIITTAAASLFYNKGVPTKLAALFETPLWIVSTAGTHSKSIPELNGVVLFPFGPKEMPELLFNALLGSHPSEITRQHTGGALEAVNLLLLNKGQHALLSEPSATLAVLRSEEMEERGVPRLIKQLDVRELWKNQFKGRQLFVSGFALFGDALTPEQTAGLLQAYSAEVDRINASPKLAMAMAEKRFPALAAQSQKGTIPGMDIRLNRGEKACSDTLFFLSQLSKQAPRATGGKLPGADFFMEKK